MHPPPLLPPSRRVTLADAWEAMRPVDPAVGLPRGFLHLAAAPAIAPGALLTLSRRSACCAVAGAAAWVSFLRGGALRAALDERPGDEADPAAAIARSLAAAPRLLSGALELYGSVLEGESAPEAVVAVMSATRAAPLYSFVAAEEGRSPSSDSYASAPSAVDGPALRPVALTLLLAAGEEAGGGAAASVRKLLALPAPGPASDEAAHLRCQLAALSPGGALCGCG